MQRGSWRTQVGFLVQRAADVHVMRNIGNGDEQTKTLGILLGINRVIEVTCILAIDGDQWQCAQVEAPGGVRCLHLRIDLRRLAGDGLGSSGSATTATEAG